MAQFGTKNNNIVNSKVSQQFPLTGTAKVSRKGDHDLRADEKMKNMFSFLDRKDRGRNFAFTVV